MVQNIHILTLNLKRAKQWRLVRKIFGRAANVMRSPPDPPHENYANTVTLTTSHYNFNLPIGQNVSSITYAPPSLCVILRVYDRILIILEEIKIRPADCLHQGTSQKWKPVGSTDRSGRPAGRAAGRVEILRPAGQAG